MALFSARIPAFCLILSSDEPEWALCVIKFVMGMKRLKTSSIVRIVAVAALLLALGTVCAAQHFHAQCDEHASEQCSPDCSCAYCISSLSAISFSGLAFNYCDGPAQPLRLPLADNQEDSWVRSIDRPPRLHS